MLDNDPFQGLEEWARDVERRATRGHRRVRLRRALTAPVRLLRRARGIRTLLVIVLILVAAAGTSWALGYGPVGRPQAHHYPTTSPPPGLHATSSASAAPTDPFAGTPAATYPQGADGFTMPPATPLDGFTTTEVTDALGQVRAALVAAWLDRTVLVEHRSDALTTLLAKDSRDEVVKQFANPAGYGGVAVLISDKAKLAAQPPRVSGRTTVASATDEHGIRYLKITTNYVIVYPFEPDGAATGRLALEHIEVTWWLYRSTRVPTTSRGLWVGPVDYYVDLMDCAEFERGMLAPDRGGQASASPTAEPSRSPQPGDDDPDSYFDPNRSLDVPKGC